MKTTMCLITPAILERGKTGADSWTRQQLTILGVSWPPTKGWKSEIEGSLHIPLDMVMLFHRLGANQKAALTVGTRYKQIRKDRDPLPSLKMLTVCRSCHREEWSTLVKVSSTKWSKCLNNLCGNSVVIMWENYISELGEFMESVKE